MRRAQIINKLIEVNNYTSYLEIGVRGGKTTTQIKCQQKVTVDPNPVNFPVTYQTTSDEFFKINTGMFDMIFVDGLHQDDQVYRDIVNSLNCLTVGGTILVHDCLPPTELSQSHTPVLGTWCGTVWKAFVRLRATRPDLFMTTINTDFGCGLIRRGSQTCIEMPASFDFKSLQENKEVWLNLISLDEATEKFFK